MPTSRFSRVFDSNSLKWSHRPEDNKMYLKAMESYANDCLQSRGHVFLNEVYDMLGMPRSHHASFYGWFKEPGSNNVEFQIFFENADGSLILDFNVDGIMADKLPQY